MNATKLALVTQRSEERTSTAGIDSARLMRVSAWIVGAFTALPLLLLWWFGLSIRHGFLQYGALLGLYKEESDAVDRSAARDTEA